MKLRSLLFVPGDSERQYVKGQACGADALILDLEESVAPSRKDVARSQVAALLNKEARDWRFFVRVNSWDSGLMLDDLAAVVLPGLDGLLVPKVNGADDIVRVGHYLDALETVAGMQRGGIRIAVVATETPWAMFALGSYAPAHPRFVAMTWGAEDPSAAIGATGNNEPDGGWASPYRIARAHCLFAAAAAEVAPIDTLFADYRDEAGLATDCRRARRDGFTGRIAIYPDQVATINACFSPSQEDVAHARGIVDTFAAAPQAGTIGLDGKMYDIPHLTAARRTLSTEGDH